MRVIEYTVEDYFEGKKLISFLRGHVKISVRLLRSLKRVDGGIKINGENARTIDLLHKGDRVTLSIPEDDSHSIPIDYELKVVYEDDDVLVIDKPAMLPMHESHNHQGDTLANAVAGYLQKKGRSLAFRAVGRLDKGTSGLVICALNSHAAARLSGNFEKTYYAMVTGQYVGTGTIDKPIYRPDPMKTYRTADDRGDKAVTHYEVLESTEEYSLLKIHLETGRTHQIRVHFAYLGTPLYGDRMYGKEHPLIGRQALHCGEVTFNHPVTGEKLLLRAELPEDMKALRDSIIN
ncbi:MAG: RluA family pseudouridine synthase [Clostridia bacterium]|nr:RluA family pseudouridine synthase [Clostridia bacterium]